jgi:hypothetical protein
MSEVSNLLGGGSQMCDGEKCFSDYDSREKGDMMNQVIKVKMIIHPVIGTSDQVVLIVGKVSM